MEERRDAVSVGLPPLVGPLKSIYNEIRALQAETRGLRDSYKKVAVERASRRREFIGDWFCSVYLSRLQEMQLVLCVQVDLFGVSVS